MTMPTIDILALSLGSAELQRHISALPIIAGITLVHNGKLLTLTQLAKPRWVILAPLLQTLFEGTQFLLTHNVVALE